MYNFHELLESTLEEMSRDFTSAEQLANMEVKVKDMIPGLADEIAQSMSATLKQEAPSMLEAKRRQQEQFEERLIRLWKIPLDLLSLFISIATEAGSDFNSSFQNEARGSNDAVFKALTILHARACQISSAILELLRSGYADDAHARWRSLHEIAVASHFISQNGKDLAERYLLHDTVERYKTACQHKRYADRINEEPIPEEDFDRLKSACDQLINKIWEVLQGRLRLGGVCDRS